jgi:type II secretory pathway component PulK
MVTMVLLSAATSLALIARARAKAASAETFQVVARAAAESALAEAGRRFVAKSGDCDSPTEALFDPTRPLKLPRGGVDVEVRLVPLDDRIPLKGLFLPDEVTVRREYEGALRRLFRKLGKERLTERFLDGLDRDSTPRPGGGEADSDLSRVPADLSELLSIPGIDRELLYTGTPDCPGGLSSGLTVFGDEKININVADPAVLPLLDDKIDDRAAAALAYARNLLPLKDAGDLKKVPGFPQDAVARIANVLQFQSSYVRATILVRRGADIRRFVAILRRAESAPALVRWEE